MYCVWRGWGGEHGKSLTFPSIYIHNVYVGRFDLILGRFDLLNFGLGGGGGGGGG